jgi:hypothetical protein
MRLSDLSRRHKLLLGAAALFALLGALATHLTTKHELDRGALARLAAEAAFETVTTGSVD